MFHSTPDHGVLIRQWRSRPPTGRQMSKALCHFLSADDVEAQLASAANRSVTYVRWCLDSDVIVPASLLSAALRVGAELLPPLESYGPASRSGR